MIPAGREFLEEDFQLALERCKNGHLYDPAKHTSCPYCGVSGVDFGKTAAKNPSGKENARSETVGRGAPHNDTQGILKAKIGIDPLVGWLVCVDGPVRGMDYRIWSENNSIGRSDTMRICIAGDEGIARENHAFLTYDPQSNLYFMRPGTATGMAYHNRTLVVQPVELKPFDEIKLGNSMFLFVPLCGEFGGKGFRWA